MQNFVSLFRLNALYVWVVIMGQLGGVSYRALGWPSASGFYQGEAKQHSGVAKAAFRLS